MPYVYRVQNTKGCGPFEIGLALHFHHFYDIAYPNAENDGLEQYRDWYYAVRNKKLLRHWFGRKEVRKWLKEQDFVVVKLQVPVVKHGNRQTVFRKKDVKVIARWEIEEFNWR